MIRPIGRGTFRRKAIRIIGWPKRLTSVIRGLPHRFNWTPSCFAGIKCCPTLEVRRSSVITAACALLVRGWCTEGSGGGARLPGQQACASGVPDASRNGFRVCAAGVEGFAGVDGCRFLPTSTRECGKRCSISGSRCTLWNTKRAPAARGSPPAWVSVNFIPTAFTVDFGGVAASASYTHAGPVGGFGLVFLGDGDQLFLSTAGAGQSFSNFDVCDLAERLERVLVAMAADPTRRLSSVDLLDEAEHARLDEIGNRAVLTRPATTPVSIPALFAAQVARAPEAVALVCEGRSLTYRELDEAANRLAHLLVGRGVGPGECVALLFSAFGRGDRGDFGGAQDRGGVSADRPGAAGGADRVHARRCRADRRAHHGRAGRAAGRAWRGGHRCQ